MKEIDLPDYIVPELRRIKPSKLVLWTDTPEETAETFTRLKIDPIYNSSGDITPITVYGTRLRHNNGIFTGEVDFIPDEFFRHNVQHLDMLRYLKQIELELI